MSMSKKDFIALADALRPVKDDLTEEVTLVLLRFCRQQNSDFNAGRFMDYLNGLCGSSGGRIRPEPKPRIKKVVKEDAVYGLPYAWTNLT